MKAGHLVLESGEVFSGVWLGGRPKAGEVVFNTSHCGYEEIATDPSYHSQIMVMTAPMQGNYGSLTEDWESNQIHINGFLSLEMQKRKTHSKWLERLTQADVPVLDGLDTRKIVMRLRDGGTTWGAVVQSDSKEAAKVSANALIEKLKNEERDWAWKVTNKKNRLVSGSKKNGSRIAVMDFGVKENILRELAVRSKEVRVFSSRSSANEIKDWDPNGILLSNGPGDPENVVDAVSSIRELLGWRPIFGICMGHQLLSLALGGKTYRLKFGHRGGNHPVKDHLCDEIYMTSQNHGYAVDENHLPSGVRISHVNLYDNTIEGIECQSQKCMSVQFHPESHPGPRDASQLFELFMDRLK